MKEDQDKQPAQSKEAVTVPGWEYYDARAMRPAWFPQPQIPSYFTAA